MGLLDELRRVGISARQEEAALYELVAAELDEGVIERGLWLKALAESDGNEQIAKAKYCSFRVQSLRDDKELLRQAVQARGKAQAEQKHQATEDKGRVDLASRATIDKTGGGVSAVYWTIFLLLSFFGIVMFGFTNSPKDHQIFEEETDVASRESDNAETDVASQESENAETVNLNRTVIDREARGSRARRHHSNFVPQVAACWPGVADLTSTQNLTISLRVELSKNGNVNHIERIAPRKAPDENTAMHAALARAERAVMACQPYSMPKLDYEDWRTIIVSF